MTYDEYNTFCSSLPATSYVVQWGGSHVWKVGGKVLAAGLKRASRPFLSKRRILIFRYWETNRGFGPPHTLPRAA